MTIDNLADSEIVVAWRRNEPYGPTATLAYDINSALLAGGAESWNGEWTALLAELDELFDFNSTAKKMRCYRACPMWTVKTLLQSGELKYTAFLSTTSSINVAGRFFRSIPVTEDRVMLILNIPEGIPMLDVQSRLYAGIGENEFVLPRNLKLKLQSVKNEEGYVEAQVDVCSICAEA